MQASESTGKTPEGQLLSWPSPSVRSTDLQAMRAELSAKAWGEASASLGCLSHPGPGKQAPCRAAFSVCCKSSEPGRDGAPNPAPAGAQRSTPAPWSGPGTLGLAAVPGGDAGSPALLVQGDTVNAALGAEDVELPGLRQQLHVPHLVGAPVHGLGRKAERNVTFLRRPGCQRRGVTVPTLPGKESPAQPHPRWVRKPLAGQRSLPGNPKARVN